jgi:hypothetical protein
MPRSTFNQEAQEVKDDVLFLASIVEEAILESAAAISRKQGILKVGEKRTFFGYSFGS